MAKGRFTGGRQKGTPNKGSHIGWPINATAKDFDASKLNSNFAHPINGQYKSPKLVLLENMWYFDNLGNEMNDKLAHLMDNFGKTKPTIGEMKELANLMVETKLAKMTACQIADKVAPYCHHKMSPIEAKPEELENPFVIRAPKVIENSKSWQDYADIDGQWSNKFPEANQTIINSKVVENEINTMSEAERKVEISPADAWLKVVDTDKKIA